MNPKRNTNIAEQSASAALDRGMVCMALVLLLVAAATFGLRPNVSADTLAPLVATMIFGLAAMMASVGLLLRRKDVRIDTHEIAGILTFVGIGVSATIEAEQMTRLLTWSDKTD